MLRKVFVRSAYNYDREAASNASALVSDEETLTSQEFKEEVDINTLLRRFNVTGQLPQGVRMPTYGDFTGLQDFHEAANAISLAHESFEAMPADVRFRFGNDPGRFVEFCSSESNRAEAIKMGLVPADPIPPVDGVKSERVASAGGPTPPDGGAPVATPPAAS